MVFVSRILQSQKRGRLAASACLLFVVVSTSQAIAQDNACGDVTLTADEVETLKKILKQDELFKGMAKSVDGLEALNTAAAAAAPGAMKLMFFWNMVTITGYRKARPMLGLTSKGATCGDLILASENRKFTRCFWDNLLMARGCYDMDK
jgi:hypothetical protein